jgi:hypothetical protein
MMMRKRNSNSGGRSQSVSKPYEVGFKRPPAAFRFPKGVSGNPEGTRKSPKAPNLRTDLQRALNQTIRSGRQQKTVSKAAAGIERLVDQWAKGDRHARRDLILLCDKLGVDLTDREALEAALEDVLSAEDEALLTEFVRRHGGQYPIRADAAPSLPATGHLDSAADHPKLLSAPVESSTSPQQVQPKEKSHD